MPQQFRRDEPDERSRPVLGEPLEIDSTDTALAELERTLGTDEMRGELSKTGFMTDKRDPSKVYGLEMPGVIAPGANNNVGVVIAISAETGKTLWKHEQRAGNAHVENARAPHR